MFYQNIVHIEIINLKAGCLTGTNRNKIPSFFQLGFWLLIFSSLIYACYLQDINSGADFDRLKAPTEYDEIEQLFQEETIEEEVQNSTDLITANTYGDFGDAVFIAKSCPPEVANSHCLNGGTCFAQYHADEHYVLFCKCARGWEGHQCQFTYNPKLYEMAIISADVESTSIGEIITVIFIGLIILSGIVYLFITYCNVRDLRDYMFTEASIDPTTMTPVQMYPFSQRSLTSSSNYITHVPTNTVSYQEQRQRQGQDSQITLNYYNQLPSP